MCASQQPQQWKTNVPQQFVLILRTEYTLNRAALPLRLATATALPHVGPPRQALGACTVRKRAHREVELALTKEHVAIKESHRFVDSLLVVLTRWRPIGRATREEEKKSLVNKSRTSRVLVYSSKYKEVHHFNTIKFNTIKLVKNSVI